ncbi:zinc finger MYM-type protein 1-like [Haemaphysalis longicornis]
MRGQHSGLQALIREEEPRAIYVHCLAHVLNLVLNDVMQTVDRCRDILSVITELISFVTGSPKCLHWFKTFQEEEESVSLVKFCPTRWTLKASSLSSVLKNYRPLILFLQEVASERSESSAKASGLTMALSKFQTYFMLNFKKKTPCRYDDGSGGHVFHSTEDLYRQLYYNVVGTVLSSLDDRYPADTWQHIINIEQFLAGRADATYFSQFYGSDFQTELLKLHRDMLLDIARQRNEPPVRTIEDVVQMFRGGEKGEQLRGLLPEIATLVKIALTVPVTSCTSERSFSCLRRVKTYLRSTMGQTRLNHVALLHGHKELSRKINLDLIADEFIGRSAGALTAATVCRILNTVVVPYTVVLFPDEGFMFQQHLAPIHTACTVQAHLQQSYTEKLVWVQRCTLNRFGMSAMYGQEFILTKAAPPVTTPLAEAAAVVGQSTSVGTGHAPAPASPSSKALEGAEGMNTGGPATAPTITAPPVVPPARRAPAAVAAQPKGPKGEGQVQEDRSTGHPSDI